MLKKLFFLLSQCAYLSAFATEPLPSMIDFSRFTSPARNYHKEIDTESMLLGYFSFNYASELTPFFALLKRDYHIDTVIETGTFQGGTTVVFSLLFDEVHTIEFQEEYYNKSKEKLQNLGCTNVHFHLGSSETVLSQILPSLAHKRILFYLDAHWNQFWPLLFELDEISKTHCDNCLIVIDDFKVPGRKEIPYDKYEGHSCSYEYIEAQLQKVFTGYTTHYLIPKNVKCRAKFIAIPTKWMERP